MTKGSMDMKIVEGFAMDLAHALVEIGDKYPGINAGEFIQALESVLTGSIISVFECDVVAIRDYMEHLKSTVLNHAVHSEEDIKAIIEGSKDD